MAYLDTDLDTRVTCFSESEERETEPVVSWIIVQ